MPKLSALLAVLKDEFPRLDFSGLKHLDSEVKKLTSDSRAVLAPQASKTIYVAVPGTRVDGHTFLREVEKENPALMIGERSAEEVGLSKDRYLEVPDARAALGLLASEIEANPSREMLVLGITGTSGKTTTSYLVESILREAGKKVGLIGTVSFRIDGHEIPSTHTTPGPVELQQLLRKMRREGCDALVMEVSSHALKQHRAIGVAFDGGIFTNLSAEHLDYHPNMEDYFLSKKIFFDQQAARSVAWGKAPVFVVHEGTEYGDRLLEELNLENVSGFSVPSTAKIDARGIQGTFSGVSLHSKLIGQFNAENIAAAVALIKALPKSHAISDSAIRDGIQNLERIPGRLEQVPDETGARIILVDYAHKPDALEKVLEILRPMRKQGAKLFCVFGCGGDRDRAKRPVMGEIACRLADQVIFTNDNPRTEDPESILDAIQSGCEGQGNWKRISDRAFAIETAIRASKAGDLLLIAGKGHEDYQIIGTEKFHFDDREVVESVLRARN